jgi:DNA-binding response OmpR family regulator
MAKRVLLVVESTSTLEVLRIVLEGAGYAVYSASTSGQTLACLAQQPDVILLALPLSNMPAQELFRIIKEQSSAPVLVLPDATKGNGGRLPVLTPSDAYHPRPLKLGMLFRQLEGLLGRTWSRQQHTSPRRLYHASRER